MKTPTLRFLFHVAAICLLLCPASNGVLAADINAERMALERRYTTPHSLGDNYLFDPRDGWQSVNTTNLLYKYQSRAPVPDSARDDLDDADDLDPTGGTGDTGDNDDELGPRAAEHHHSYTHGTADMRLLPRAGAEHRRHTYTHGTADMQLLPRTDADEHHHTYTHGTGGMQLLPRAKKAHSKSKSKSKKTSKNAKKSAKDVLSNASDGLLAAGGLTNNVKKIINTIKGIGKQEPVTITWYTGHDLDNPSCWANPNWAPTDKSFAAALTLVGWATKPKCFKFLELCSSPQKCIFVRVVDSCAGCAADSKHVDLTKAAFQSLADLDKGLLTVQMREATDPADGWLEDLWGPKMSANN